MKISIRNRLMGFFLIGAVALSACAGSNPPAEVFLEETDAPEETTASVPALAPDRPPAPTETPYGESTAAGGLMSGYVLSKLTGLPIHEDLATRRPVAVVINNIYRALPQSGISQADLLYEVLAEANITRLVGIFQNHDTPKIGPVRSARDYFVHFALDYDAIFVHHGGSPSGYERLNNLKINRLDGINLEGKYFWRDRTYPDWYTFNSGQRPLEHSSYTGSESINDAIANFEFRDTLYEDAPFGFSFYETQPIASASSYPDGFFPAAKIIVPFSKDYTRTFNYDPATRLYDVFNRDGPHMDANTGESLTVTNILIQYVNMRVVPGDAEGRREVKTVGEGKGILATAGGYVPVKWSKANQTSPTQWTLEDGSMMRLNPGKTWVCVFQEDGSISLEESTEN